MKKEHERGVGKKIKIYETKREVGEASEEIKA